FFQRNNIALGRSSTSSCWSTTWRRFAATTTTTATTTGRAVACYLHREAFARRMVRDLVNLPRRLFVAHAQNPPARVALVPEPNRRALIGHDKALGVHAEIAVLFLRRVRGAWRVAVTLAGSAFATASARFLLLLALAAHPLALAPLSFEAVDGRFLLGARF